MRPGLVDLLNLDDTAHRSVDRHDQLLRLVRRAGCFCRPGIRKSFSLGFFLGIGHQPYLLPQGLTLMTTDLPAHSASRLLIRYQRHLSREIRNTTQCKVEIYVDEGYGA